jgi:site-specific DNA-methyltransferase (adenine-specific)
MNERVWIGQEDCRAFLAQVESGSVDLIVTDPPYSGMNRQMQYGRGRIVGDYAARGQAEEGWFADIEDDPEFWTDFLRECRRVLAPHGHIYLMFDSLSLLKLAPLVQATFDVKNLITWDKMLMGMGHYFRRQHEQILFATAGNNRKLRHRSFRDVWPIRRIARPKYPTQKPVELFATMVSASAKTGDTVLDPFLGSGSSAIAALKSGCRFIGCDSSAEAVQLARHRVKTFLSTEMDPLERVSTR